jgi:hypothetical protein
MLPKEAKELFERIDAECAKFEIESDEAARNLGLVLSDAAKSGRRQGFFAGMKKESERSQKLVSSMNKLNEVLDELWNLAGTCHIPDRYIKAINMAQHESYQALNEYSNPKI